MRQTRFGLYHQQLPRSMLCFQTNSEGAVTESCVWCRYRRSSWGTNPPIPLLTLASKKSQDSHPHKIDLFTWLSKRERQTESARLLQPGLELVFTGCQYLWWQLYLLGHSVSPRPVLKHNVRLINSSFERIKKYCSQVSVCRYSLWTCFSPQ